ncbi:MAG: four-carbon acid sugar kinase family protein [Acidobacteriota bacterium]
MPRAAEHKSCSEERLSEHRLITTFYGDDFTGSTDALEALAVHGLHPTLFLEPPEPGQIARFPDCRAVGVAGESRSRSPQWMTAHLPAVFQKLKSLGAQICHYKVCSTFDSSPEVGNIGRALEIGQEVFAVPYVPIVVGVPQMGRYVLFGHLFARFSNRIYRIDRHPTMASHPITPMSESDLRIHLSMQTKKKIEVMDILSLQRDDAARQFTQLLDQSPEVVIFDTLDEASLLQAGRLLWSCRPGDPFFVVGSSGVEYALTAYWQSTGQLPPSPEFPSVRPIDRLVVISGSCSPATEKQIQSALSQGFTGIPVDAATLVSRETRERARPALLAKALAALRAGKSIVVYTALGHEGLAQAPGPEGNSGEFGAVLGEQLGLLLREAVLQSGVRRVVIAGGDTSTYAVKQLEIEALTMVSPLIPGAPLCRVHAATDKEMDGLEIVLKGGQVGSEDCFANSCRGK